HNSIVVLAVAESGSLDVIQHISTGGDWPRNVALDPTGQFLLAANQRSDNIVVFAIDLESGSLRETGSEISLPSPVCIRFRVQRSEGLPPAVPRRGSDGLSLDETF